MKFFIFEKNDTLISFLLQCLTDQNNQFFEKNNSFDYIT